MPIVWIIAGLTCLNFIDLGYICRVWPGLLVTGSSGSAVVPSYNADNHLSVVAIFRQSRLWSHFSTHACHRCMFDNPLRWLSRVQMWLYRCWHIRGNSWVSIGFKYPAVRKLVLCQSKLITLEHLLLHSIIMCQCLLSHLEWYPLQWHIIGLDYSHPPQSHYLTVSIHIEGVVCSSYLLTLPALRHHLI